MRHHILKYTSDIRTAKVGRTAPAVVNLRGTQDETSFLPPAAEFVRIKVEGEIKKSRALELFPTREQILREIAEIEETDKALRAKKSDMRTSLTATRVDYYAPLPSSAPARRRSSPAVSVEDERKSKHPRFFWKSWLGFALVVIAAALLIPVLHVGVKGFALKDLLLAQALSAHEHLSQARDSIFSADFFRAEINFSYARKNFSQALFDIEQLGRPAVMILEHLPKSMAGGAVSSAVSLLKAGEQLAFAGEKISQTAQLFTGQNFLTLMMPDLRQEKNADMTLTDLLFQAKGDLKSAKSGLASAEEYLKKSSFSGLSDKVRQQADAVKEKLNPIGAVLQETLDWSEIALKLLGHYQPQKYLVLFQNSGELRATGGFIGTYGLLELDRGVLKNFTMNGIYDIDGQLRENIVPPRPIQKISTAWSTHDSNWFFDFPTSAKKAAWFFEKTGNPTPDQVIVLTPKVIEALLEVIGPIEMGEYGQTVDARNFVEVTQFEVEVDYDKTLNKPKQFLADMVPKILERLAKLNLEEWRRVLGILDERLSEKDILVFSFDEKMQQFMKQRGWAGEVKETDRDFLAVVSSNINGFKTDRVIEEKIAHNSEIQSDGSIIDTVTITRTHGGGRAAHDWWNRVNANYLRVYVPLGSELLEAKGHTREAYVPPIDYEQAGFKRDRDVEGVEKTLRKDQNSGTEISDESGKTVFGNWAYVSPGESVTVSYTYRLPFILETDKKQQRFGVLVQKQPGTASSFEGTVRFPKEWSVALKHPDRLAVEKGQVSLKQTLDRDYFYGGVFETR